MHRSQSIVLVLVCSLLMAACAPAAPAPTAVPPTVTVAPTLTMTTAPTATPTLTPIPTETPTPVPTQEDFSDIEYASSIDEAMEKKPVSPDDVLTGRLIRLAESMAEPWPEGTVPATFSLHDIRGTKGVAFFPNVYDGIEIAGVYKVNSTFVGEMVMVVRFLQPNGEDGYYQVKFSISSKMSKQYIKQLKDQPYLLPYYRTHNLEENIALYKSLIDINGDPHGVSSSWYYDYYDVVQPLMDEWLETGIIPEELSTYPIDANSRIHFD